MITKNSFRKMMVGVGTAAVLAAGVGVANAGVDSGTAQTGWGDITRERVRIDFGKGWVTDAELTYPRGADGRLPVVVLLHGSGRNDMDQTLPEGKGSTFVPLAQAAAREGYAALRFNKRGVTGVGPVLSADPAQLTPKRPYDQIQQDAAAVVRFAAASPKVDPARIFLLGHSEGTNVAANLAADPARFRIPKPAGVVEMGVVGKPVKDLLTYQVHGRLLTQLHDEFDVDGDGLLTATEATDGLVGQPKEVADQFRPLLLDGRKVAAGTDRNHDGRIAIDAEAGAVLRKTTRIDDYPNVPDFDPYIVAYAKDIARFPTVTQALPKFAGPSLLLNGENDIQTPARAAIVAHAAVVAAGRTDTGLTIYPGMAHTMNITSKYQPAFGGPDERVVTDIRGWLRAHR